METETYRESREFYYVSERGEVEKVTGHACVGSGGYWWCPSIGMSVAVGYGLYRDRREAYGKALAICKRNLDVAQAILNRIEREQNDQ